MKTINYFTTQLKVELTMREMYLITHALATLAFDDQSKNYKSSEENDWELWDKINDYIKEYQENYNVQ